MLYTKDGNSNSNFVLMQLAVFIVDSSLCVLNYPIGCERQSKSIAFRVP